MDRKTPLIALLMSIVPGAGHIYAGSVGKGIAWLLGVAFAWSRMGECAGLIAHLLCASSAVEAVKRANAAEEKELGSRRESASQVGSILDAAVQERGGAAAPFAAHADEGDDDGALDDPPPRMVTAGIAAAPVAVTRALADTFAAGGLEVRGVDKARGIVKAMARLDGVKAPVVARVEPTPNGARIRMLIDRPAGSPRDDGVDDRLLRRLLAAIEQRVAGARPAAASAFTAPKPDAPPPPMSEEDFFDELQEAWEAHEQGWMPEDEWLVRKAELVRDVMLRPETRESDFIHACRPLVEAGVLTPDDLRAMENAMRGR